MVDGKGKASTDGDFKMIQLTREAAQQKDAVLQASIDFIAKLTGMTPPPIETADAAIFAPFKEFADTVCSIFAMPPALDAPAQQEPTNDLHSEIMNLRCDVPSAAYGESDAICYKMGHRDARHAAAELALAQHEQEPVGCVAKDGFTILYFQTDTLPFETDLYTAPPAPQSAQGWTVYIDRRRLRLMIGVQSFAIQVDGSEPEQLEWYRDMLTKAMQSLAPQARDLTDSDIDVYIGFHLSEFPSHQQLIAFARALLAASQAKTEPLEPLAGGWGVD